MACLRVCVIQTSEVKLGQNDHFLTNNPGQKEKKKPQGGARICSSHQFQMGADRKCRGEPLAFIFPVQLPSKTEIQKETTTHAQTTEALLGSLNTSLKKIKKWKSATDSKLKWVDCYKEDKLSGWRWNTRNVLAKGPPTRLMFIIMVDEKKGKDERKNMCVVHRRLSDDAFPLKISIEVVGDLNKAG